MFGFTLHTCSHQAETTGKIPYPVAEDKANDVHAVVVAGYDDALTILNTDPGATATTGALLFRNSWGTTWGEGGYGWLPYEYVHKGDANDWWVLIKADWLDTKKFGF